MGGESRQGDVCRRWSLRAVLSLRGASGLLNWLQQDRTGHQRMIETSGVIEKEQGNGFYLVTLVGALPAKGQRTSCC